MQQTQAFRLRTLVAMVAAACAAPQFAAAEAKADVIETKAVEVISTTPLAGIGLPIEQVPANVQVVKGAEMQKQGSVSIADYMNTNLQGVSVNDTQNNPFQPDVSFRGYAASPLLGTPQGLSVYVDGVRVNEPFGDVVSWDLIPMNAISGMSVIPGSNPLFGLNTLGGAISVQTKSGRTHQGGAVEALAGSWNRKSTTAEYGGVSKDGSVDFFISGSYFDEDGWRDHSDTEVRQLFGKVGWQNETTKIDLSYTGADNDMIGNGLQEISMRRTLGRDSIFTKPDQTENKMSFLNLTGAHWFNDDTMFSGNAYYRNVRTRTLNGDLNDNFDENAWDDLGDVDCAAGAAVAYDVNGDGVVDGNDQITAGMTCSGALNRSSTRKTGYGATGQFTFNQDFLGHKNQFIAGLGYDYSRIKFKQHSEFGTLNAQRGVNGINEFIELDESVDLKGTNRTWSVFATDTFSITNLWHLTLSGRYNHSKVDNDDKLDGHPDAYPVGDPASLTAEHSFHRFNPAIGLNFTPTQDLTVYGSYNEGSRAPTSMELGCANPDQPCKLPNAMAGDPPLKQVVAKTYEAGLRGNVNRDMKWSLAAYRATNHDDIQFLTTPSTTNGMGFFDNVGKTRRVGLDGSLMGTLGNFSWMAGYSYVHATYESDFSIANAVNSAAVDTDGDGNPDTINVRKGDRLAGIPQHQLKLRAAFQVTPAWSVGSNLIAFSEQYARGNENNAHQGAGGKIGGYAVVNLDTRYAFNNGWQVFAKANNIFDREYNNGGMLGQTLLNADGTFAGNDANTHFVAPGAPRAGWIGVRYEFGGKKSGPSFDNN